MPSRDWKPVHVGYGTRIREECEGARAYKRNRSKLLCFDDTTEVVKLHQEYDFVHRNMRAVNIMIDPEVEAKLIDFDWAGKSCSVALLS